MTVVLGGLQDVGGLARAVIGGLGFPSIGSAPRLGGPASGLSGGPLAAPRGTGSSPPPPAAVNNAAVAVSAPSKEEAMMCEIG